MENRYERQLAEYATSVNDALREQLARLQAKQKADREAKTEA